MNMDSNKARINITLSTDGCSMLDQLADGERKRGDYLDGLIRREYAAKQSAFNANDADLFMLRAMLQALLGRVMALEGQMQSIKGSI